MTINIWDPMTSMARLSRDMDDFFRRAMKGGPVDVMEGIPYAPAADISRDGNDAVLMLEMPGMNESDIDIDVEPGRLTISGRREERIRHEDTSVRELRYGEFRRDFALPQGVTADHVSASYDRGILEIRIKDAGKTTPKTKKIPVQRAKQVEK